MSFGISIGDLLSISKLAWSLYHDGFLHLHNAPQDFRLLVDELRTLYGTYQIFETELKNPDSWICKNGGEEREKMVRELIRDLKRTLEELYAVFEKHRWLGMGVEKDKEKGIGILDMGEVVKRGWDRVRWVNAGKDVERLRQKLAYHNGVLSLLLTCAGNSSLQRLEIKIQAIEAGITQLQRSLDQIHMSGTLKLQKSIPTTPNLESVTSESTNLIANSLLLNTTTATFKLAFTKKCLSAAEVTGRRWAAVGIQEWIHAGRWWLLRAQIDLCSVKNDQQVPKKAYLNLLKAMWILTDIITFHPQFSQIETKAHSDVQRLLETITQETRALQAVNAKFPALDVNDCDNLQIWDGDHMYSSQTATSTLTPMISYSTSYGDDSTSSSGLRRSVWTIPGEHIVLKSFATYQAEHSKGETPCLVLFLLNKSSKAPRLLITNQSWRELADLRFTYGFVKETSMKLSPSMNVVTCGEHVLTFVNKLDCELLYLIILVYSQYHPVLYSHAKLDPLFHYGFMLIVAMHVNLVASIEYLLSNYPLFNIEVENTSNLMAPSLPSNSFVDTVKTEATFFLKDSYSRRTLNEPSDDPKAWGAYGSCAGKRKGGYHPPDPTIRPLNFWLVLHSASRENKPSLLFEFLKQLGATSLEGLSGSRLDAAFNPSSESICSTREDLFILRLSPGLSVPRGQGCIARSANASHLDIGQILPGVAARQGYTHAVAVALTQGFGINSIDKWCSKTLLYNAIMNGQDQTIEMLLSRGASWNLVKTKQYKAPFVYTLINTPSFKIPATLKALRVGGADIDSRDADGCTAVFVATERNDSALVRMLVIELGADITIRYSLGCRSARRNSLSGLLSPTILQFAASKGYAPVVKVLLDAISANLASTKDRWYVPSNDVKAALYEAVRGGHIEAIDEFLNAGYAMDDGLCLSWDNNLKLSQQPLLLRGIPVTDPDRTGKPNPRPFLINAIRACPLIPTRPLSPDPSSTPGSVLWDILHEFETEAEDLASNTTIALHNHDSALEHEVYYILHLLIQRGADRMARDESNNTALHYLVPLTHWSTKCKIKILSLPLPGLDNDPLINVVNTWNVIPLHYSLARELVDPDIVEFMVFVCGARVDIEDCDGLTALDYAIKGLGWVDIGSKKILEKYAPVAMKANVTERRDECIQLVLKGGARPDAVHGGVQKRASLHYFFSEVVAWGKETVRNFTWCYTRRGPICEWLQKNKRHEEVDHDCKVIPMAKEERTRTKPSMLAYFKK